MSYVLARFHPYEPTAPDPRYQSVRLLVLGESHYEEPPSMPEDGRELPSTYTQEIVRDYAWGHERHITFFGKLFSMLSGEPWSPEAAQQLWQRIFFYNYVQHLVPGGPRHAPTPAFWAASTRAFGEVLDKLKPEAILVMGRRLWENMDDDADLCHELDGGLGRVYCYRRPDGRIVFAAMTNHPSSPGFTPSDWHPKVHQYLRWVRTMTQARSDA